MPLDFKEITNNAYGAAQAMEVARDYLTKAISILNALEPTLDQSQSIQFASTANVNIAKAIDKTEDITGKD
ncbi:MAG: hypothetical protein RBJ76_13815 [Stenomitos frigidus ULC029]